jgi:metal-responsive CopG/Arc/MetJ family transcriptional regulator
MTEVNLQRFESLHIAVTLPVSLVKRSQRFIDNGTVPSRNALVVAAVERFLIELERQEIDQQFAVLADDLAYQELNVQMSEEFADSDWEAIRVAEEGQE